MRGGGGETYVLELLPVNLGCHGQVAQHVLVGYATYTSEVLGVQVQDKNIYDAMCSLGMTVVNQAE